MLNYSTERNKIITKREEIMKQVEKLVSDYEYCKEALQKEVARGIIYRVDGLESTLEMIKKDIIKKHEEAHKIWQGADGRWRTRVPDKKCPEGRRMLTKTYREDLIKAIVNYYTEEQEVMTLARLFLLWKDHKVQTTSLNNVRTLIWTWEKYFKDEAITNKKMSDIDIVELSEWMVMQIRKHSLNSKQFGKIRIVISGMYDFAVMKKIVSHNIVRDVKIARSQFSVPMAVDVAEKVYCEEEWVKYQAVCRKQFEKSKNVAYLALLMNSVCGLRVGELLGLQVNDFRDGYINIRRQQLAAYEYADGQVTSNGYRIENRTKTTSSTRQVPMVYLAEECFKRVVELNKQRGFETEHLFLNKDGKPLTLNSISYATRTVNKMLGTKQKGNHALRRTYGSMLLKESVPLEEVRSLLGHSESQTTLNHYNFVIEAESKRVKKLENILCREECNQTVTDKVVSLQEYKKARNPRESTGSTLF